MDSISLKLSRYRAKKVIIKTLSERFCELNRLVLRRYFEYLADGDAPRRAVLRHVHGERALIKNWKKQTYHILRRKLTL